MKFYRRILAALICAVMCVAAVGCAGSFDPASAITVITREDGSGTRSAFIELTGVEEKDADGNKVDKTTLSAEVNDSTGVVLANVAQNPYAIGYISLGSLGDTVKALAVDGVAATVENVKNGSYKVSRPFNIVIGSSLSETATDFIGYIMSADGQALIEKNGYIALEPQAYSSKFPSGKVVVKGSSSVTPVMEKLAEAYELFNTNATVEVQQSDSSNGVKSVIDGICDIGMASRELKDSESSQGVTSQVIAIDGIAVIVNLSNTVESLTSAQIKSIYTGETKTWSGIQ